MAVDQEPLLSTRTPVRRYCSSRVFCPLLLLAGCIGLTAAILIGYFADTFQDGISLRVMSLNTWGMPHEWSEDKELRMLGIGQTVAKQEFDLYLLEELWMEPDHTTILSHLPQGYQMTTYDSMTQHRCPRNPLTPYLCCDGVWTPSGCSGLAIISRYPLKEVEFTMYDEHGPMDGGEKLARKGFGRVRVEPRENVTVDVFVTHTCASDEDSDKQARMKQVSQLMSAVRGSKADFVLLGGDFNSDPRAVNENTYSLLKTAMSSSMEEFFKSISDWLVPTRASYGNPRNTYSNQYAPVLYDYIWHRSQKGNLVITNFFDLPFLTTIKKLMNNDDKSTNSLLEKSAKFRAIKSAEEALGGIHVSLSDHEPVSASLFLVKKKETNVTTGYKNMFQFFKS